MKGKLMNVFIFMLMLMVLAWALPSADADRGQNLPREGTGMETEVPISSGYDQAGWASDAYRLVSDHSEAPSSTISLEPIEIREGDFNEDGRLDIVTCYSMAGLARIGVRLSTGAGQFSAADFFELGGSLPTSMVLGDVNLDGHMDVAVGFEDSDAVSLLEGTGTGSFFPRREISIGSPVNVMAMTDLDKDGYEDLLVASTTSRAILYLHGTGADFEAPFALYTWPAWVSLAPMAMRVTDVDWDGMSDIILLRRNSLEVLYATSVYEPATMGNSEGPFVGMELGDINNDGLIDVVAAEAGGDLKVFLGDAEIGLLSPVTTSTGVEVKRLVLAHLNEDGYLDVTLIDDTRDVTFLLGDGRGGYQKPVQFTVDGQPTTAAVMRLNKDALDDLVIATSGGGTITLAVSAPADIRVTTTRDVMDIPANGQQASLPGPDGLVSLREAIVAANNTAGPQTIAFNIPRQDEGFDGTVFRIRPSSALPELSAGGTTIDGLSQTLFTGNSNPGGPEVLLDGRSAGRTVDGLLVTSALNVIQGLVINNYSGSGVKLVGRAIQNVVAANYIGTNEAGTEAAPNQFYGVIIGSNGSQTNIIGGTVPEDRNLISGNANHGVTLQYPTFDNRVVGNYIGTTASGTSPVPNGGNGVFLTSVRENLVGGVFPGSANVISGNLRNGVSVEAGLNNSIAGNVIGTDHTGSVAVPNGQTGVVISTGSDSTLIGGTTPQARNVIASNGLHGVEITASSVNTRVSGNYIGTDKSGTLALANGGNGVTVASSQNLIGGSIPQTRNVISGNRNSGVFLGNGSSFNKVEGNFIGVDASGMVMLANSGDGLSLKNTANNTVGGSDPGNANVIASNRENGVTLVSSTGNRIVGNVIGTDFYQTMRLGNGVNGILLQDSTANVLEKNTITGSGRAGIAVLGVSTADRITQNAIFDNSTLGIDLAGDGVTQNDPSDLDSGPNEFRNFPIITGVQEVGSTMMVSGVLPTFLPQMQTIELFRAMPSPTGYGEGGQYLGQTTPDAQGQFSIMMPSQSGEAPLSTALANGDVITATAIDLAGNTSEFSPNFIIGIGDMVAPSVLLLSPNGGEQFDAGDPMTIKWRSFDNVGVVAQDVLLSTDGGATFRPLQTSLAGTIQELSVKAPVVIDTAQAVVCVIARDGNRNEVRDCSDGPFVIYGRDYFPPSVALMTPNGGEIIPAGQPFTIRWAVSDDRPGVSCTVSLSTNGGSTYTTLVSGLMNTQSYEWPIPAVLSTTQARIRVVCRDASGQVSQDESDANFAIDQKHPSVTVDTPDGGNIIFRIANNPLRIEWTAADDVGVASHDILLSTDGGRTFDTVVITGLPGTARSFDWVVPRHSRTGKAAIRIITRDFVGRITQDDSDRTFILFRP